MKVLKFGGTSVGTSASLANVKKIVDSLEEPGVVVVSALGGLTDGLMATARIAAAGDQTYHANMQMMARRHFDIINEMIPAEKRGDVRQEVGEFLSRLEDLYTGVALIHDLPDRVMNRIVSFGERMSSIMVANILNDAVHADPLEFIKTERRFGKDILAADLTEQLIRKNLPMPLQHTVVTGGFISRDKRTDEITNLGRGGSDFTAALIAAALGADVLEIWTDVDGFMTADPRVIPNAKVIETMSYADSMTLCSFGAKVIYPPTMRPVYDKGIAMKVLNTHRPAAPGTLIDASCASSENSMCGVSSVKNAVMLSIDAAAVADADLEKRVRNSLRRVNVSPLILKHKDTDGILSVVVLPVDGDLAEDALKYEFADDTCDCTTLDIRRNDDVAVVAAVGAHDEQLNVFASEIVDILEQNGIGILADTADNANGSMAVVVNATQCNDALKGVHSLCFPMN